MKNLALVAIVALSFTAISCNGNKEVEAPVEEVEVVDTLNAAIDSTAVETPEVSADSVENVIIDSAAVSEEAAQ
ncbi:MAG TPA: hypothetical protein VIG94_06460 [Faecalibacter sp.]